MDVVIAALEMSGPATFDSLDDPPEAAEIAARLDGEKWGPARGRDEGTGRNRRSPMAPRPGRHWRQPRRTYQITAKKSGPTSAIHVFATRGRVWCFGLMMITKRT